MSIVSVIVTVLLVGLGAAVKLAPIPAAWFQYLNPALAVGMIIAANFVPPYKPGMLPARVGHFLQRVFTATKLCLGVLAGIGTVSPAAQSWIGASITILGAIGTALFPSEPQPGSTSQPAGPPVIPGGQS